MERLNKFIWFCLIIFLINILCLQSTQATSPDKKVNKLEERELTTTLYVISLGSEDSKLKGVEFLWIPDSIEARCVNKSYESCRELNRSIKNKLFKRYPTRILTSWVAEGDIHAFPENKQILEELSKIDFIKELIKETNGERHFDFIEKVRKIKARVHWELWPNGENFRVIKVISK